MSTTDSSSIDCPCGTGATFDRCCEPIHRGDAPAITASALMRSRYSAFVQMDEEYLLHSWHPDTRPSRVRLRDDDIWLGLEILATERGNALDNEGTVDFAASLSRGGAEDRLREISRFSRVKGRWVYVDGSYPVSQ